MERLVQRYQSQLDRTNTVFVRYLHDNIRWNARLNAILGARGVGKTTLMFQHILLTDERDSSLVVFADDIYFSKHTLIDLAETFYKNGGKHLYIDEVHKYRNWSTEIKNIYDQIPDLQIVYTGSSILDLEKGGADLSRRQLKNRMHGMSFREWLQMTKGIVVPKFSLDDILSAKATFPYAEHRPLPLFKEYLEHGYFPFCQESDYLERLNAVVEQTLETDIPQFAGLSVGVMHKLKQLMQIISQISPFKPNYSDLARDISVARNDLKDYLYYMEKSGMIQNLPSSTLGMNGLAKVEKIYLDNTNLMFALINGKPDTGNLRETFFFNQMKANHIVIASDMSDFLVDGHTFEVGGHKKGRKQIAGVPDSYVVKDDIEYAAPGVIPLWMFGLNY
ncbi:MAG: AAA family ATPase [Bacteroidales bacterium]|nr:AAA family ATPase [Bacteroidales bacterium]